MFEGLPGRFYGSYIFDRTVGSVRATSATVYFTNVRDDVKRLCLFAWVEEIFERG